MARKNRPSASSKTKQALTAYVFILPAIVVITLFVIIPLIYAIVTSFYDWSFYTESTFVGLDNYRRVLGYSRFRGSFIVAFEFLLIILPTQLILSFLFAHGIKGLRGRFSSFVKTSIYVPNVISGIVAGLIFSFIYYYQGGILNSVVTALGFEQVAWLVEPGIVKFSVALPVIWMSLGYNTLLMLAGLNDIPQEYYEVASLDGANFFQRIWYVTLPQMKNLFIFMMVTGVTSILQFFDIPMLLTQGGPMDKTMTPMLLIYERYLRDPNMNFSVTASLIMFVVLGSISIIIFRTVNSEKLAD